QVINATSQLAFGVSDTSTTAGKMYYFVYNATLDKIILSNSEFVSSATQTAEGIIRIVSQTDFFNKDSTKAVTAENIANDVRLCNFNITNQITGLNQVIPTGNETLDGVGVFVPGYNLLTSMISANETYNGNIPLVYKDI